ncbi:hypothetical protein [Arthrobacter sp. H5]|uniref:hypothetical protein n=1 Tax=Arthrobacter sp. H5 TaxID=1267973 RepID=UPI0012DF59FF|nr:hypothetical protein [Arthrobacter sp. H5]
MNTSTYSQQEVRHPERGRRYSIVELRSLADGGDAWAISRVDDWEMNFSDEYAGSLAERCTDPACDGHGEPVDLCCDEAGNLRDADHGGWGHELRHAEAA